MAEPKPANGGALGDELKQLVERNVQANLQLLSRAGSVLRDAARDPKGVQGADARGLFSSLLRLEVDYLKALSDSSVQYLGAVVSLAESALKPQPQATTAKAGNTTSAATQATVLHGHAGETVAFQFRIDNPNAEAVDAAVEVRDWTGDGDAFAAHNVSFAPAATVLEPGASRMVQGRIVVDERFRAGRAYETVIRIVGFPGRETALRLVVEAGPKEGA